MKSILDGGNGGMGGSVVIRACKDTQSLSFPATVYKAPPGANGSSNNKHGKQGKDVVLRVPVGTVVRVRGYHGNVGCIDERLVIKKICCWHRQR